MTAADIHVVKGDKRLRSGHTTGTCAAAASKAALTMLLTQKEINKVRIITPNGTDLTLTVENAEFSDYEASCAVRKDGGDDTDCTHGTLIRSNVSLSDSGINIDGGKGIGRVTKKGLDQPVGNAAINSVPRDMISRAVDDVRTEHGYRGGVNIIISAPEGEELAKRTFNPRLGIIGGISIIGTSGIVEPMSEKAMIDTMRAEMSVQKAAGSKYFLIVPGNYGKDFVSSHPKLTDENAIKCSNFIGEALDSSSEFGAEGVLLVGNIGKMVKIAGGIMNTHSKHADCRMEILVSCALSAGLDIADMIRITDSVTTEDALDVINATGKMNDVMRVMMERIAFHMENRVGGRISTGAIVFSSRYGEICRTDNANDLIASLEAGP
ncbi:MAG: cobalt-precorrin-5B (C(1))-methyltransferase CbiD [Methanomassiliicoccaceae archaeon]|nr:cobalt-precorrin-5B (C(1))-methyltransferase CbiD [Methanomassiliicoccaceae archaeon]